jgi:hypothetical protein
MICSRSLERRFNRLNQQQANYLMTFSWMKSRSLGWIRASPTAFAGLCGDCAVPPETCRDLTEKLKDIQKTLHPDWLQRELPRSWLVPTL